ncbi:BTAD domain-containing putative transcriptional regulator [Pseudonocardia sp. DLS-67]
MRIQVLGPVAAYDEQDRPLNLRGPRHRAVLARLIVARGRTVPVPAVVEDLWPGDPPRRAVGAVRTFVSDLRAALGARMIATAGPGYAFRGESVDAWRFESAVARSGSEADAVGPLEEALDRWRGPAYADFPDAAWLRSERRRLTELRLGAVEQLARARLAAGRPEAAVPDLDAHVTDHPWREEGWRLLALALYRCERPGDALAVLRRARHQLVDELGIDPGPTLAAMEIDILRRSPRLLPTSAVDRVWASAAAEWERSATIGARAKLESTTSLLRSLAIHGGGPRAAAARHAATVAVAEQLGDSPLTARVIGGYGVPSVWARSDDPRSSAVVVAAAERALPGADAPADRARLLAAIAIETRGVPGSRGPAVAREAERLARRVGDPALLGFALSGRIMQSFHRAGLAAQRGEIAREIRALAAEHELPTYTILGHLVTMQSLGALGDLDGAAAEAAALAAAGARFDSPLVPVFVAGFGAVRAAEGGAADAEARYREAARLLAAADMPGVEHGLLDLALVCLRLRRSEGPGPVNDPGPYAPWIRPHLLLADGRTAAAADALRSLPEPPPDQLLEVLWCLAGRAALVLGDAETIARAERALAPAAGEIAGAGSGMLTFGPVSEHLDALRR